MTEQEIMVIEGIGAVECGGVEIRRGPPRFPVKVASEPHTAETVLRALCDLPQSEQDRAEEALREWLAERGQVRARWREMMGLDATRVGEVLARALRF